MVEAEVGPSAPDRSDSGPKVALVAHWDWVLYNFRLPIARRLRERGCEVTLITPSGRYVEKFAADGFRWVRWRVERRGLNPLREAGAIRELTSIYRHERFDVVHHFTIKPNLYGSFAARRVGTSVVLNTFTGLGFLFSEDLLARAIRIAVLPGLRNAARRQSVWTIFQNEDDLATGLRGGWAAAERSVVIPGSGVPTAHFRPRAGHQQVARPTILMACRLVRQKGVEDLVAAASMLRDRGVTADFVVAGAPDEGNPASLRLDDIERWADLGIVRFIGHQDNIRNVLWQADIAVLPTYYPEGLPRFLLEAAATGLPLVATDIAPCRPIVRPGVNGFLVPSRSPAVLASAIEELVSDPDLRARYGEASRKVAAEEFSEKRIIDQYMTLYDAALNSTPA